MADNQNQFNQNAKETAEILKDAFMSLGAQIDDIFRRAATANDSFTKAVKKDLTGTLNSLARNSQQLLDNQYKLEKGQLASRNVAKQIYDITAKQNATQKSIKKAADDGILTDKQKNKLLGETNDYFTYQLNTLNEQLATSKSIESRLGVTSKIFKDISKIPLLGSILDTDAALSSMQQTATKDGSTKFDVLKSGLSEIASTEALIATGAAYLGKQILVADENTTKLAKSLNQSKTEAAGTQVELTAMAFASGDAYLNTSKLVEATVKLGQQLGVAKVYSADVTTEFAKLTGQMGLAEESAAGLAKMSVMLGKNSHNVTTEALGTAQALQSQAGIQLDNKQILEESGKVSGQLLANFKGNPTAIAAAVTQAKLLGTSLETTKKQAESLLDFESSIQNELQAELMTGQQLNLERARAAALMGDQETVMKELANQNMNFTKFSQMNTIAQKNVAAALGLSADELSDQLATQQFLNKSRSEVVALAGEEVAKRLEAQKAQDKFNNALEKLQDVLMPVLTALAFVMDKTADLLNGNIKGFFGADDLMSGYGNRTLVTPQGSYALNNNDTVIAGTNLFKGNDVYSGPKDSINLGGSIDYDKLASAMSKVQVVSQVKVSEFANPITIYQQQNMRRSV
jgi:hypothetical protein